MRLEVEAGTGRRPEQRHTKLRCGGWACRRGEAEKEAQCSRSCSMESLKALMVDRVRSMLLATEEKAPDRLCCRVDRVDCRWETL